jgi:hypothetical protein
MHVRRKVYVANVSVTIGVGESCRDVYSHQRLNARMTGRLNGLLLLGANKTSIELDLIYIYNSNFYLDSYFMIV